MKAYIELFLDQEPAEALLSDILTNVGFSPNPPIGKSRISSDGLSISLDVGILGVTRFAVEFSGGGTFSMFRCSEPYPAGPWMGIHSRAASFEQLTKVLPIHWAHALETSSVDHKVQLAVDLCSKEGEHD